ncbi:18.1 kda class i heat shock protein [Quercus suber]|uniref:18.1 kDa class i heat shock protein n=1 Tax=Quercus suber TaxID=58331 RepID=A0AAW0LCJ4_QUESU
MTNGLGPIRVVVGIVAQPTAEATSWIHSHSRFGTHLRISRSHLNLSFAKETSALVDTRVDWKETPEAHVFKADLPGLNKEEVKVEVEDDRVLQISGERKVEKEEKKDTWHRVERSSGKFLRRFRLPENAKMDQTKASMENGVLTVTVPKVEVKKPDVKSIRFLAKL